MVRGVIPDTHGFGRLAACLMVYDWQKPVASKDLVALEACFRILNENPVIGTGHLDDKRSHGTYSRVRRRLAGFLDRYQDVQSLGIKLQSAANDKGRRLFASAVSASIGASSSMPSSASIAVELDHICSANALVKAIAGPIFEATGPCYGGAFNFPILFGPDGYRVSLAVVPRGVSTMANREYSARITRWRDNLWHRKLRPSSGYFREVYPVNLLLEAHLHMPFQDRPLSEFMTANGSLRPFQFQNEMYQWDVPVEMIEEVREQLEPSGLILSAETHPLIIT